MIGRSGLLAAVAAFGLSSALSGASVAQGVIFCMRDGQQVKAEKFETRDGKFYLFVSGSSAPLEYQTSAVMGINVTCTVAASASPVGPPIEPSPAPSPAPVQSSFGIHGSNTIGERLMPLLIETFGQRRLGSKADIEIGAPEEQTMKLAGRDGRRTVVQLQAHGSGTASKALLSGAAEIGMSSRQANDAEAQAVQAARQIDIRTPGNEYVLALDGLAVIVNAQNPLQSISLDVLAQIFSGQVTNWAQIGGNNAPIIAHRRDDKSGTFDTFNSIVLAPRKVKPSAQAKAHESSEILSDEVARDVNAIGFIGLPYINRNKALSITDTCGLASGPSKYTVKTETYPLARRLYLYTLGQPSHPVARDLLSFVLSDEAQPTIEEAGFVEQSVEFQSEADQQGWAAGLAANAAASLPVGKDISASVRDSLLRTSTAARRTSLQLRFARASAELDTRALQDVERFKRYLGTPAARGKRFWIVGFADSDGGWQVNARLAGERAASVGRALQQVGVQIRNDQLLSFSYLAPVACNDTDAGRAKNRRVEIWLAR